ncbi:MAG: amidohydrolase [Deltaproteobacteria bacterium]|nr:amidohydrolase [Deltaproteobacteria bacterium]MBW2361298.1 amidohydrolase [Deltaproteobacteria bacterium]
MRRPRAGALCLWLSLLAGAAHPSDDILALVAAEDTRATRIARQVWDWAELGYLEERSSALLRDELRASGFRIESGIAGLPTAFIASAGSGSPVVAILAEFDALPGISQTAAPRREQRSGSDAAHACGHNLFAGGSVSAAVATANWLRGSKTPGTLRVYGTPAEEGGSGKVYMVRAGLFDDVDAALHWHPSDHNDASPIRNLANKSAKFRFRGVASHAAAAPERGRSALDAVEAMNFMVNLLREHVPETTRIHYVITDGGRAPNVVPENAEVFYYVRHPDPATLEEIWARVEQAARGAAAGTGTALSSEVIHGNHSLLPNESLARLMHAHAAAVGGPVWDRSMRDFAAALARSLPPDAPTLAATSGVESFEPRMRRASTDVGDVSWAVPTTGLLAASWPPGTVAHTWQSAAASGSPFGEAGMHFAARVLAATAVELFESPALLEAARGEHRAARGANYIFTPLLGDRAPPLDYRR